MSRIESIELLNYRSFRGSTRFEMPESETAALFLDRPGRSTVMRAVAWCLTGRESRAFLGNGGTNDNLPNFEEAASNDTVEVMATVTLSNANIRWRFERSATYRPPDLRTPQTRGWEAGNTCLPPPEERRTSYFDEGREMFITDIATGVHAFDLDFVGRISNGLVDEHIAQLVQQTRGRIDQKERDRIEASMREIMVKHFGRGYWGSTISEEGRVSRFKMNWSGAMMMAALSDFGRVIMNLVPALALLEVYGRSAPIMVKASDPQMLEKTWKLLDEMFPESQKIFLLPSKMRGTVEMLAAVNGWEFATMR